MPAFFVAGRAMNDGPRMHLGEALDLVRAIESQCRHLRREGGAGVEQHIAELEAVVREINEQLNVVIVKVAETRQR